MKVLYLAYTDIIGGAARGAYRVHRALIDAGVNSRMLVRRKFSNDDTVTEYDIPLSKAKQRFNDELAGRVYPELRKQYPEVVSFNLRYTGVDEVINRSDADVLIMHWIGADTINFKEISRIRKPIIWRMADAWAICGARHYVLNDFDKRFLTGYENTTSLHDDVDAFVWRRKKRYLSAKRMMLTAGSEWLINEARKSPLYKNASYRAILNGIELDVFKPMNKELAKQILGLNAKRVILFGAVKSTSDYRKGYDLLQDSLSVLSARGLVADTQLLIFGGDACRTDIIHGFETTVISEVCNNKILSLLYSAADVMAVPSRADVLPFTAIEALACATPVVVYGATGMSELIEHKKQGYIAKAFEPDDFATGLEWVMNNSLNENLPTAARARAEQEFDVNRQAREYIDLITEMTGVYIK